MSTDSHRRHILIASRPSATARRTRVKRSLVVLGIGVTVVLGTGVGASAARIGVPFAGVPTVHGPSLAPPSRQVSAHVVAGLRAQTSAGTQYPVGTPASWEPSGMAPPSPDALAGYELSYVTDFSGRTLPQGWMAFTGQPGGDPGAWWSASHVSVYKGLLRLHAWRNSAGRWITGGVCQCGRPQTYGAYFVRSRVTGKGPTEVELLWPADNSWPPEVDFNESSGGTFETQSTDHWGLNFLNQHTAYVNLTKWHTFGVIWSPGQILYVIDGHPWARITAKLEIPSVPMTLDLTQQTWCALHWACPSKGQTMGIDWVAEYTWASPSS